MSSPFPMMGTAVAPAEPTDVARSRMVDDAVGSASDGDESESACMRTGTSIERSSASNSAG